jgi:hypothetical protein
VPAGRGLAHREVDRELADDRLTGSRGRCHQDAPTLFESMTPGDLERIQLEPLGCRECGGQGM